MIISEYLPGKEFTVDVLSDLSGAPLCAVPRERIETKAGISVKGKIIKNDYIQNLCLDLAKYLNLKGPVCMQLKEDQRGILKFLEINPRIGGGTIMSFLAGINFIEIILKILLGDKIDSDRLTFKEITVLRYYEEVIVKDL